MFFWLSSHTVKIAEAFYVFYLTICHVLVLEP